LSVSSSITLSRPSSIHQLHHQIGEVLHRRTACETLLGALQTCAHEPDPGQGQYGAAAFNGHKDVAELLLANKAEVNAKSIGGYTPLHFAADHGAKATLHS
jgi:hypothetical protein